MRKIYLFCLLFFFFLFSCLNSSSGGGGGGGSSNGLSHDYTYITNVIRDENSSSGINMGNALESPNNEGEWGVIIEESYFTAIKNAGFKYMRIPVRWSDHADAVDPFTINSTFMDRVKQVVDWSLGQNLITIINIHHYNELFSDPAGHKARFLKIWEQIAANFNGYSSNLYFEILNEPNTNLTPVLWNTYLEEARTIIRGTGGNNAARKIIIGTANWGGVGGLSDLVIPDSATDPNIIVTFHYYNPFQFTHQGAEWVSGSDLWLGTTWTGTSSEKQAVINDFDIAENFSSAHDNVPVLLGEFGAYSKADTASRKEWTAFVAREAERRGFFWAYWEFCSGFGAFDSTQGAWRKELLDALVPED